MRKKPAKSRDTDEVRPEYNLSRLQGKHRGKHFQRYQQGTNLALLAPVVRAAFPDDESVNRALRSVMASRAG
jgi:hypothetical protein